MMKHFFKNDAISVLRTLVTIVIALVLCIVFIQFYVHEEAFAAKDTSTKNETSQEKPAKESSEKGDEEGDGTSEVGKVEMLPSDNAAEPLPHAEQTRDEEIYEPHEGRTDEDARETSAPKKLEVSGNEIDDAQQIDNSFLFDVEISSLMSADAYYNGRVVRITGEAVGQVIQGVFGVGNGVWVTLHDQESDASVVVFMSEADAKKIDTFGGYGKKGSIVQVQGTFNIDCLDHQSETDIHATSVSVLEPGVESKDAWKYEYTVALVVAGIFASLTSIIYWRMREKAH